MADHNGDVVGAVLNDAIQTKLVAPALKGGFDQVLIRDRIELATAVAQNDRIILGSLPSTAIINPLTSFIWFDDLGTGITLDVGDATDEDALVAAQDVATAAGSCSVMKSVDIANYFKPLWEVLGLSADPGGEITLYAKLEGGDPGAGTIAWQIVGQANK